MMSLQPLPTMMNSNTKSPKTQILLTLLPLNQILLPPLMPIQQQFQLLQQTQMLLK
jgi:hypothetical protein